MFAIIIHLVIIKVLFHLHWFIMLFGGLLLLLISLVFATLLRLWMIVLDAHGFIWGKQKGKLLIYFKTSTKWFRLNSISPLKFYILIMGGYIFSQLHKYLVDCGIDHHTACVGTPQQKGVAERKNRHLLEVTRSLLFGKNVLKTFWSEALLTTTYLINRMPFWVLNFNSPFAVLCLDNLYFS